MYLQLPSPTYYCARWEGSARHDHSSLGGEVLFVFACLVGPLTKHPVQDEAPFLLLLEMSNVLGAHIAVPAWET